MTRRPDSRPLDDTGASLLVVLAFVTGVLVIASSLLAYSGTSLGGVKSTKFRNDVSYDVDGALKAGITQIRNSEFQNMDPTTCGNYLTSSDGSATATAMNFPASNQDGNKVVVTCSGGPNTGLDAENVPITASNRPGQAVLVLANSGTGFDNGRNGNLSVKGKIRGNSTISSSGGGSSSITVLSGEVKAPSCSGTITVLNGTKDCAAPATWSDPSYPVASGSMTHRSVPSCNTTTTSFEPGYYDDAEALSNRINNCNAKLFWFKPGVYYFDFRNDAPSASTYLSGTSTSTEWLINNQNALVVAGTPSISTTNPPAPSAAIPGACVSPLNSIGNNQGVTFIFGGSSRLNLTRGYVEICGQYSKSRPPTAFHGATTTTATDAHATATVTTPDTTHSNTTGDVPYNNPNGAITAADSTAATVLPSPTPSPVPTTAATARIPASSTASATFPGFAQTIPQHSTLTKADLVVIHRENRQGTKAPQSVQVTLTPSPTGSPLAAVTVPQNYVNAATGGAFQTDTIDLLPTLASKVYADGLTSLTAKYAVSTQSGGAIDSYLDQIKLVLEWDPPTLRPIRTTDSTYRDTGQPILYTTTANNNRGLYIQGTTYVPTARLDLTLNNASAEVFRSGIVAWRAAVNINPSTAYTDPVIEVPDQTLDYSDVYFTAWVCPTGAPPTTAAAAASACTRAGTARVSFQDDDPASVSTSGNRKVRVYSWTIYR